MGKRSEFERVPRDFYKTPFRAVPPLIPYLHRDGVKTFAERCCGDDDLIRHIKSFGFSCVSRGDIRFGQDALKMTIADLNNANAGITNPPLKYPGDPDRGVNATRLLRDLIQHSLDLGIPFWMLIYSDWKDNQNAAPFLKRCSDIVAVGRIKWIVGTKSSGKDNCSWYRFDAHHQGDTAFHNDRTKPALRQRRRVSQIEPISRCREKRHEEETRSGLAPLR